MMIEIRDFQKMVDPHTTLDIPLLIVDSGEVAAVVGSTGSGIDTLVAVLCR